MKRKFFRILFYIAVIFSISQLNANIFAASLMDRFIDPNDGMFDSSTWLLEHKGFLPVPQIITEPAIGYGAGVYLLFLHDSIAAQMSRNKIEEQEEKGEDNNLQMIPPSASGVGGFKTENDTWGGGGFHFASWKEDHIRYLGVVGKMSLNLKFYGISDDLSFENGLDYNLDGWGVLQEIKFRIGDSKAFLGGKLTYFDNKSKFIFRQNALGIEEWELDLENIGVGIVVDYDSMDNSFTPNRGMNTKLEVMFFRTNSIFNTTREYQMIDVRNKAYWKIKSFPIVMGWRLSGRFSSGSVPFYALPFIDLRGIPKTRYQGTHALETEIEARYQMTKRWGLLGFGGVGRTSSKLNGFDNSENRWSGGMGIRYMIARVLKLQSGIDIAKSSEGWTVYFKLGSGL